MDQEPINWMDPDLLEFDASLAEGADQGREQEFKQFFESTWHEPQYDDLRERWDPHLHDEDAHARVLAKTALWSIVQHRKLREIARQRTQQQH